MFGNVPNNMSLEDLSVLLSMLVRSLTAPEASKSRERALIVTKLDEARLWALEAFTNEKEIK